MASRGERLAEKFRVPPPAVAISTRDFQRVEKSMGEWKNEFEGLKSRVDSILIECKVRKHDAMECSRGFLIKGCQLLASTRGWGHDFLPKNQKKM